MKINERTIESILEMYNEGITFEINNGEITTVKNPTADQSTQVLVNKNI